MSRKYGQHFLKDEEWIHKIVDSARIGPDDRILEIGPGKGALTGPLCEKAGLVLALEIDPVLARGLARPVNLQVQEQDILEADLARLLPGSGWKVVANLPYYITTPILEKLFQEGRGRIGEMWLMMQHEVARRIVAPATREAGSLTYFAHFYTEPTYLFKIPPQAFSPPPQVDSAVVHFRIRPELLCAHPQRYFTLVRTAFHMRRKMLSSSLGGVIKPEVFEAAGIDPRRRPETLQVQEFLALEEAWGRLSESGAR